MREHKQTASQPWKRERRVYIFECTKCGRNAQSYKRKKVRVGLCKLCKRNWIHPDQLPLFAPKEESNSLLVFKKDGLQKVGAATLEENFI